MATRTYLDFATTTPLDARVERAMKPYWTKSFGNPSSLHAEGVLAKESLESARRDVANAIQAHPHEIIFTGSGTEANNLAILGCVRAHLTRGTKPEALHALVSSIEHSSVRECFEELARLGVRVETIPVSSQGIVSLESIEKLLKPETVLISVMYANNEIGTIQPIRKIASIVRKRYDGNTKPALHVDACQAPLYLSVLQSYLGADLVSFDAHKMYGPKGVGALYVREGTKLTPILFGGGQERGRRPGTENIPLVIGFAKALELAVSGREKESKRITLLRDMFFNELMKVIPSAVVNGDAHERLPNNVNIAITGLDAEFACVQLDTRGISCSAKSACLEGVKDSFVISALGKGNDASRSSLRFSLGRSTTRSDVRRAVRALSEVAHEQLAGRF